MPVKESAQAQSKHQDVLTFKPESIKVIRDEKTAKILKDESYYLIIKVLRKGPMTVREIEKAYDKEAEKCECESKSDKTLYRYLKVLEDAKLVVPAGQRVIIGKTATETLFSRTARVFLLHSPDGPSWWRKEEGTRLAQRIGTLLGQMIGKPKLSIKCLQDFLQEYDQAKEKELEEFIAKADEKVLEDFSTGEWKEITKVIEIVKQFGVLLNHPEYLEKLRGCFKEK